jgi:hypothetical protein
MRASVPEPWSGWARARRDRRRLVGVILVTTALGAGCGRQDCSAVDYGCPHPFSVTVAPEQGTELARADYTVELETEGPTDSDSCTLKASGGSTCWFAWPITDPTEPERWTGLIIRPSAEPHRQVTVRVRRDGQLVAEGVFAPTYTTTTENRAPADDCPEVETCTQAPPATLLMD